MIAKRRAKVDDRNRELLPDSPESDPREVLDYLRRFSGPDIPAWVLQAEIADALTLNNWLWWEDRRRELYFLKAGRDRGIFLAQLGSQVGVKKQGVIDRIDRLEALLSFDRPDEKITRTARRSAREARLRRPVEEAWLQARRDELIGLIAEIVGQADRYEIDDDEREWVDQLAMDARDEELAPATWAMTVPLPWLAAPVPPVRRGDAIDILAMRSGDKAYALPVAYGVRVLSTGERGLLLEVDKTDATAIATAHGGGLLLVPLLRSTR